MTACRRTILRVGAGRSAAGRCRNWGVGNPILGHEGCRVFLMKLWVCLI